MLLFTVIVMLSSLAAPDSPENCTSCFSLVNQGLSDEEFNLIKNVVGGNYLFNALDLFCNNQLY
jgi:hypothetical protein